MRLNKLVFTDEYSSNMPIGETEINSISVSKETITSDCLFVLTKSINFDIHKIINYVINKAPRAIICDDDLKIESESILILKTASTRKLLPYILARFYNIHLNSMRFIGITGTAGKTTTATIIHHILSGAGYRCAFIGTGKIIINGKELNDSKYSMTTPDPTSLYPILKEAEIAECQIVIMEVSSHALYFDKVAPIIFDVSVFTNLSEEHLDFHKDLKSYYQSKLKLFSQSRVGVFNLDDRYSSLAYKEAQCQKRSVGILYPGDISGECIELKGFEGSEYMVREANRLYKIKMKLNGIFNIYNAMLAIAVVGEFGIKPCFFKNALNALTGIEGRMEIIHQNPTVIIDYAHTTEEMKNVLNFIYSAKNTEQKLITLFGCGGERDKSKRPKMAKVAEEYSDFVIVTSDNSRNESETEIIRDILSGFTDITKRKVIVSRKNAIEYSLHLAKKDDIVVLLGKGHERYNLDKNGSHDFDERIIVSEILKNEELST